MPSSSGELVGMVVSPAGEACEGSVEGVVDGEDGAVVSTGGEVDSVAGLPV
jgi:hypothetical protein